MQAVNVCPTFPISTGAIPSAALDDKDTDSTLVRYVRKNQSMNSEKV